MKISRGTLYVILGLASLGLTIVNVLIMIN